MHHISRRHSDVWSHTTALCLPVVRRQAAERLGWNTEGIESDGGTCEIIFFSSRSTLLHQTSAEIASHLHVKEAYHRPLRRCRDCGQHVLFSRVKAANVCTELTSGAALPECRTSRFLRAKVPSGLCMVPDFEWYGNPEVAGNASAVAATLMKSRVYCIFLAPVTVQEVAICWLFRA